MGIGQRARLAGGVLGPVAFTAAWVVSTVRQPSYTVAHEHISGLAAPDARTPAAMVGGFLALGAGTVTFARALDERLGGTERSGTGPILLGLAGVAALAAGVFRRDRMSNVPPPDLVNARPSVANDLHDLSSVVGQAAAVLGLLSLARRLRDDRPLRRWAPPVAGVALVNAAMMSWFASDVTRTGNGIVQRVGISLPLTLMAALAVRLLRDQRIGRGWGHPVDAGGRTIARVRRTSSAIAATSSSTES